MASTQDILTRAAVTEKSDLTVVRLAREDWLALCDQAAAAHKPASSLATSVVERIRHWVIDIGYPEPTVQLAHSEWCGFVDATSGSPTS